MPFRPLLFPLFLLGPASLVAADPPEHRVTGDLAIRARGILVAYCGSCHGGTKDPKGRLRVADHAALVGHREPVPFASVERSQIVELIEDGSMPPGARPRPNEGEREVLRKWAANRSPKYPAEFGDASATEAVLDDFNSPESVKEADREYVRYVSLAHLVPSGGPAAVGAAERRLADAVGDRLRSVDAAATVFRLDLRDPGWHHRDLFDSADAGGTFPMIPFDLILLENPYTEPPGKLDAKAAQAIQQMNAHRRGDDVKVWGLFRPPLFLRGDWLADALRTPDGQPTPLADDLTALGRLAKVIDDDAKRRALVGPKAKPFADATKPLQAARPPLGSWATRDVAAKTPPFTLKITTAPPEPLKVRQDAEFKITAECDRDANVALIDVSAKGGVSKRDVVIGAKLKAGQPAAVSTNPDGVFRESEIGTVHYVLFVSAQPLALTAVKSRHGPRNNPIYRFFPDDPDAAAVRKVIPIDVTE